MDEVRERMLEMVKKAESSAQPLSWFEDLYRHSNRDRGQIPWDWEGPHPFLVEWSNENEASGRALVVGSGLGEDASFLWDRGWSVTAFDISEEAVEWARHLHNETDIEWVVGDLLLPRGQLCQVRSFLISQLSLRSSERFLSDFSRCRRQRLLIAGQST